MSFTQVRFFSLPLYTHSLPFTLKNLVRFTSSAKRCASCDVTRLKCFLSTRVGDSVARIVQKSFSMPVTMARHTASRSRSGRSL